MNDLLKYGKDYSRLLQLEDCIPCWEAELPEMKALLEEMTWNLQQKEAEKFRADPEAVGRGRYQA